VEQEPEHWQSGAAGACVTIESPAGLIELWVQSSNRYRVKGPNGEQIVEGFQRAREVAHELTGH
jgi:hypothetical protein